MHSEEETISPSGEPEEEKEKISNSCLLKDITEHWLESGGLRNGEEAGYWTLINGRSLEKVQTGNENLLHSQGAGNHHNKTRRDVLKQLESVDSPPSSQHINK